MVEKYKISGIYKIVCTETGKVYIGSAKCIRKRFYYHRYDLRLNKHHSEKLQYAWNKHGEKVFQFQIIEEAVKENILEREQYWIDFYDSYKSGFNCNPIANNCTGRQVSMFTRMKISKKLKGKRITYHRSKDFYSTVTQAKMKSVFQYDLSGKFIKEYSSIKDAELVNNMKRGRISCAFKVGRNYSSCFFWFLEFKGCEAQMPMRRPPISEHTKKKISESHRKRIKKIAA